MRARLFIICFLISTLSTAQRAKYAKQMRRKTAQLQEVLFAGSISRNNFAETLPIRYIHGKIYVTVNINGKDYNFVLDTGAPTLLSDELLKELNLDEASDKIDNISVVDASGSHQDRKIFTLDSLRIGSVGFVGISCLSQDFIELNKMACQKIDGIIGANLMRKCKWKINFKDQLLSVSDRAMDIPRSSRVIKFVESASGNPYIRISNADTSFHIEFDTGDEHSIDVGDSLFFAHNATSVVSGYGCTGQTALQQTYENNYGTISGAFMLDSVSFSNKLMDLSPVSKKGTAIIGTAFMDNYDVYMDWQDHKIYLNLKEQKINRTMSQSVGGVSCYPTDGKLKVVYLWKGSQADQVGIRIGDDIISFNGKNTTNISHDEYCQLTEDLQTQENVLVEVKCHADGTTKTLYLNRYLLFPGR